MPDLHAVVKAYDIRGIVPGPARRPRRLRARRGHRRCLGRGCGSLPHTTCGIPARRSVPRSPTGAASRGAHVLAAGLGVDRHAVLRVGSARPRRGDVHGQPQSGRATTASSSAARAPCRSAWTSGLGDIRDRAQAYLDTGGATTSERRPRPAASRAARRLRPVFAVPRRSPRDSAPASRRRRGQRDGRAIPCPRLG